MSSLPYSANFLSKEEEKRELDSLTDAEKQAILNDKYGQQQQQQQQQQQNRIRIINRIAAADGAAGDDRQDDTNNTNNNNNNNNGEVVRHEDNIVIDDAVNEGHGEDEEMEAVEDDEDVNRDVGEDGGGQVENNDDEDISEQMLREFHAAIDRLPSEMTEIFWRAVIESEVVVEEESYPAMFLRAENYDPERAALRLCEYWNTRYEIFGDDEGFGPMVVLGPLVDAILPMILMPNFMRILPNDDHGRTVVCFDKTGIRFKDYDEMIIVKIIWFVFNEALKKQSTQRNGIVIITINKSSNLDFLSLKCMKLAKRMIHDALPIKICYQHNCVSSLMDTMIMPVVKYLAPREIRLRMSSYDCLNQPRMLRELERCGLHSENLPRSIGGSYDEEQPWITECKYNQQSWRRALRRHEERRQISFEETRQMDQTT